MRCVYVAENVIDAHLVRDQLIEGGIPAEIHGEALSGGFGLLPGYVSVWVSEDNASAADEALENMRPAANDDESRREFNFPDGAVPV